MNDLFTILFWNVHASDLSAHVGRLAYDQRADIVILAECPEPDETVRGALSDATGRPFGCNRNDRSSLRVFWAGCAVTTIRDERRAIGWRIVLEEGGELGVMAVHLPSRLHREPADFDLAARHAVDQLQDLEKELGHARTVVLGDFNMDPFEPPLASVSGFHAVLDRNVARRRERTVQGETFRFLYNPMWSRMGDCSPGPPGSYYYDRGGANSLFWHMFDQALVRPDLIDALHLDGVGIIDSLAGESLLEGGKPCPRFSDHLPLRLTLVRSRIIS